MKDQNGKRVYGRTRWRRFGLLMVPGFAVIVTIFVLVANGILAVSFSVNGQLFKLNASTLNGTGFTQIGGLNAVQSCDPTNTANGSCVANHQFSATTILGSAHINNLHQTVCAPLGPLGNGLITIDAGSGADDSATQPSATGLTVDAQDLQGDATFTNINIGQDFAVGSQHFFSQHADSVSIANLQQSGTDTTAGSFLLPGLHLTAKIVASCP